MTEQGVMLSGKAEQAFKVQKATDEDSRGGGGAGPPLQSQKMFVRNCVAAFCGGDVPGSMCARRPFPHVLPVMLPNIIHLNRQ